MLEFEISGTVIEWRGPAPFYFLPTPIEVTEEIETYKRELTYGWGVIPAKDYDFLKKEGVVAVFGPGTILSEAACEILNQLLQEE